MIRDIKLFPHVEGKPNLSAFGEYALLYKHPDDLHLVPIFDQVSLEFIRQYVRRQWCLEAVEAGWEFIGLHTSEIQPGGTIQ